MSQHCGIQTSIQQLAVKNIRFVHSNKKSYTIIIGFLTGSIILPTSPLLFRKVRQKSKTIDDPNARR